MSPAEDALLLLRLAERHLSSLRGTLVPGHLRRKTGVFWRNRPWRSCSRLCWCFTARSHPAAIRCNVCCRSLARYDAEPTPLPPERRLLLEQLEAFHAEVSQRLN